MSTPNVFARRALKRFEDAVRNHEMKGTCHPDEHTHIEQRYQKAKRHLMNYLPPAVEQQIGYPSAEVMGGYLASIVQLHIENCLSDGSDWRPALADIIGRRLPGAKTKPVVSVDPGKLIIDKL